MTGYVVHHSDGDTDRTESVPASSTSSLILNLTLNITYTITVDARSEHICGESETHSIILMHEDLPSIPPRGIFSGLLYLLYYCLLTCNDTIST